MKFTLCIPAYNEAGIIIQTLNTLEKILQKLPPEVIWEIVVADNASTDGTKKLVEGKNILNVKVYSVAQKGKGVAIRKVAENTETDYFGFIDADLSADPEAILEMINLLKENKCDITIGSRLLDSKKVHRGFWRTLSSKIFNFLQSMILGLNVKDTQCGLKIMNRNGISVFRQCEENSWFFDMELLALAVKNNLKILELPIAWEEFRYEGRKTKLSVFRDGFKALSAMFRIRNRINNKKYEKRSV